MRRLVVVGGCAAGMSAASAARRVDPALEIVVVEATGYVAYGLCGIPYYLAGLVERADELVAQAEAPDVVVLATGVRPATTVAAAAGARAKYYPGSAPLSVRLVHERAGRVLGAQLVGREGAAKRVDVVAAALHARLIVADLSALDLSYAPPFAPVQDPLLVAAQAAARTREAVA